MTGSSLWLPLVWDTHLEESEEDYERDKKRHVASMRQYEKDLAGWEQQQLYREPSTLANKLAIMASGRRAPEILHSPSRQQNHDQGQRSRKTSCNLQLPSRPCLGGPSSELPLRKHLHEYLQGFWAVHIFLYHYII